MPVEEIVEGIFHFLGRIIVRIFVELFFEILLYYVGSVVLFIVTFGQYPSAKDETSDRVVSVVGLITVIVMVAVYIYRKNS